MVSKKRKVYIIGIVGVPACYGGFESLVDNLLDYTPDDVEYTVFCSQKKYEKKLDMYKGARLVYLNKEANGKDSILYDYEAMIIAVKENADVMLILGVSGCVFLPVIRRSFKGKIITNIDGLEWKRDKWNICAKWFLHFSEKQAVKFSDVIIGDNKAIVDYVNDAYSDEVKTKQVQLIAYGGDQVNRVEDEALFEDYAFCREPYACTVCRIEPENNLHVILAAYSSMPEYNLVVVGNWEKSVYGKSLRKKYEGYNNIYMLDPIYDPHIINWLRGNATLYVHGHSAGGTNPSLAEAMNLGLPILAYDCVYNRATTFEKALYWKNESDIINCVKNKSEFFPEISKKMFEIGKNDYCWKKIAELYNCLLIKI